MRAVLSHLAQVGHAYVFGGFRAGSEIYNYNFERTARQLFADISSA